MQHGQTGDWTMRALVDTGAPITFFDRGAGEAVGVRFDSAGADYTQIRILGGTWRAQFEFVQLHLTADPATCWDARVAFVLSPQLRMPFQGVLGTEGFFDRFAVTFNKYEYFVVERPDDFHDRVGALLMADPVSTSDHRWRRGSPLS